MNNAISAICRKYVVAQRVVLIAWPAVFAAAIEPIQNVPGSNAILTSGNFNQTSSIVREMSHFDIFTLQRNKSPLWANEPNNIFPEPLLP
jgi:hypothetical protein